MERKINFITDDHIGKPHRSGWRFVSQHLESLHNPYGVKCFSWGDRVLKEEKRINEWWTGFIHNVIDYPVEEYPRKYSNKIYSLRSLVEQDWFHHSLKKCKGLFVLSNHTQEFLQKHVDVPVVKLWHPSPKFPHQFSPELLQPRVMHIGQWMRKYHSFLDLETDLHKIFLKMENFGSDYEEMMNHSKYTNRMIINRGLQIQEIQYIPNVPNNQYDELMCSSIVFLDLYDVSACNTIIECIMMNTPILIKKLPAVIEYLGENYPLFFESLEEASQKLHNRELLMQTHTYLTQLDKSRFRISKFLEDLYNSTIYKEIPTCKL
jgi:hypothetical protein